MDERYYAAELAGYCNRMTAWRIIKDVSEDLLAGKNVPVNPFCIEIKENGDFALVKKDEPFVLDGFVAPEITDGTLTEASQVWALAASVFYIVMGCQIMNGKGGRGQLKTSKIPYMRSEMPQLSELVQKCLDYHPELRPSLEKVHETACEELAQCDAAVRRGPKFNKKNNSSEASEKEKDDIVFWPEVFIILVFLVLSLTTHAQKPVDNELQHLIGVAASLRQPDMQQQEQAWNNASEQLGKDNLWTIMDEITPHQNECRLTDRKMKWFAINRILSQRMGYEKNQVRGDFNNGEDPNFNYSLIERSVKANQTVNYDLKSREGEQTFVIMPFDVNAADLRTELYRDSTFLAQGIRHKDGNIYLHVNKDKNVVPDDILNLIITNNSEQNIAVIIINHNTRDKKE